MSPIRVVHLIEGSLGGGAARGAYWLHRGLRAVGVDSSVLTDSRERVADPHVAYTYDAPDLRERFMAILRPRLERAPVELYARRQDSLFTLGISGQRLDRFAAVRAADILHLHWIGGGFVDPCNVAGLEKPIVWTMRDMWPITGGCHYTMGCERFTIGCGECPQLGSRRRRDLSWWMARRKRRHYPRGVAFVALSSWLADEARRSFPLEGKQVVTIGNNVDCAAFFPADREEARRAIGLPDRPKKVILAGAQNVEHFYKGFDALVDALNRLDRTAYVVLLFGRGGAKRIEELGFEVRDLGFLTDNAALRLAYSAADVFVAASRMETFGKTIAEAMACARPVVCFDATGPRDIVDHRVNGYRAAPFDPADLAAGIEWVTSSPERWDELAREARAKVERSFDSLVVARQYEAMYGRLLAGRAGEPRGHGRAARRRA